MLLLRLFHTMVITMHMRLEPLICCFLLWAAGCTQPVDHRSLPTLPSETTAISADSVHAKLKEIAAANQLASLAVYSIDTNQWFSAEPNGLDTLVPHPASTIKVIIAAATLEAIENGVISLSDEIATPEGAWVQWEDVPEGKTCNLPSGTIDISKDSEQRTLTCYLPATTPGTKWTVAGALFYMLSESHSSATNTLIGALGGPQELTSLVTRMGYRNTHFGSYFYVDAGRWSRPRNGVDWFASSPRDLLTATAHLYSSSPGAVLAQNALFRSRPDSTFGLENDPRRLGNKIGLISSVIADVGIFSIGDRRYLISTFAEVRPSLGYGRDYNRIYEGESQRITKAEQDALALFSTK